jgi:hypothetical protein
MVGDGYRPIEEVGVGIVVSRDGAIAVVEIE